MPVNTPIDVDLGKQENEDLKKFVKEQLKNVKDSYDTWHTSEVDELERLYKGLPENESRDWPWPGASNVVIQLIGENVDILKARIIGTIYEILPLWVSGLVGDWSEEDQGEKQRDVYESFLNLMGMEPSELDLYRVESLAANDMVKLGSVLIKFPWETDTEKVVTGPYVVGSNGQSGSNEPAAEDRIIYDGPRPEKVNIRDWAATIDAPTWEKADFKYHHYVYTKQQLERAMYEGGIEKEAGQKLLKSPDRIGANNEQQKQDEQKGLQSDSTTAQWDIYECWFWYWHNNAKWRIIYKYHEASDTKLKAVFNFYPDNEEPFEFGRLGYTDDGLLGYGFAKMLKFYQEEVTTGHNQRNDNRTLGNTSIVAVGRNNKLDANISVFPMATLPVNPDEFTVAQLGVPYPTSVQEEELTIQLAKSRCGVDPPGQGSGGGITNPKKGNVYSAMGTFSIMQSGNRRVNVNITDFRYIHLKMGRKFGRMYSHFGVGDRLQKLGNDAKFLKMALENIRTGRLDLPIKAATASINKELEKQNDMLLTQTLQRHHASIAQILQGIGQPGMPPELRYFLIGVIGASGQLMSKLLRNFGHDDISRLQPELKIFEMLKGANKNGNQPTQGGPSNAAPSPAFPVPQQQGIQPSTGVAGPPQGGGGMVTQ